ncbi:MAG: hypothetical protein LBC56_08585 [Oscillospiraceae bacterium]|jgi:hypothetical protein|nr:hypothetical protein [Oscillospiraceae bacterium]
MASSNKTDNLNLNKWIATDKPKREDFVSDNEILDQALSSHTQNSGVHINADERTLWTNSAQKTPVTGSYVGDGTTSRDFALGFQPEFIIVAQVNYFGYIFTLSGEYTKGYMAMASPAGGTPGLSVLTSGFRVKSAASVPSDGMFYKINDNGKTYIYIAFR